MSSALVARLNYVELRSAGTLASKAFFEQAFGWRLADFGPAYAATTTDDVDIGIDGSRGKDGGNDGRAETARPPLPVIEVDDLERAEEAVGAAGGVITIAAYDFPGGRRFHFCEPGGNELAVWQRSE